MKKLFILIHLLTVGTIVIAQNGLTYYNPPAGYSNSQLRQKNAIFPDNNGNIWVAYEKIGLAKLNIASQSWTIYDTINSGIASNIVRSLEMDANGDIWAGTLRGLCKFNGTSWTIYSTYNSAIPDSVINSLKFSGNSLVIGTTKGLSILTGTTFVNYSTINSLIVSDNISCLEAAANGDIFIGTPNGLSKLSGTTFTNFTPLNSAIPGSVISSLKFNSNGNLWIATNNGLRQCTSNPFSILPVCQSEAPTNYFNYPYYAMEHDNLGKIVTFQNSLFLSFEENYKCESLNLTISTYSYTFTRLKYDNNNFLWVSFFSLGTSQLHGIYCFDLGQSSGLVPYVYPPTSRVLEINQVAAMVHNLGDMHWDLAGTAKYEVPKCSGKTASYASALWLGGIDNNGVLKAAAMTYRQNGTDYWAGPLDTTNGSFDSLAAAPYNKIWKVNRFTIEDFKYHFLNGSVTNGTYPVPQEILTWPAQGSGNLSRDLAPFVDFNSDGVYNPYDGDYPLIKGDQMLYSIFNDVAYLKTETNSATFNFEIHASAYAYTCPSLPDSEQVLNYTTLYNYKIINRGALSYDSVYAGVFSDVDLGYYNDDYSGCDISLNTGFCYNGDNVDDLPDGYGTNPPMVSDAILQGPIAAPNDGIDNDHDGTFDEPGEHNMMNTFVSYVNDNNLPNGNPSGLNDVYNYLTGTWRDGTGVTTGGNGYNPGSPNYTPLMFPDKPYSGSGWSEITANNTPTDKRYVVTSGPFTIAPGESRELDYAVVFAWDSLQPNGLNTSIAKNTKDVSKVISWFNNNNFPSCLPLNVSINEVNRTDEIEIYPNPAIDYLMIDGFEANEKINYEILNSLGQKIKSGYIKNSSIKITDLQEGFYFIKLESKNKSGNFKFVKRKA